MKARWLFPPLLGLAAFATGWIADDRTVTEVKSQTAESPPDATSPGRAGLHGSLLGAEDTPASRLLAFRQAVLLPPGLSRTCALADALDALSLDELPAALALALRERDETAEELVRGIFQRWTRLDPKSAGEAARSMPYGYLQIGAVNSVAFEWARSDAAAAMAWVRTLNPGQRIYGVLAFTGSSEDMQRDPAAAMRAALALPGELFYGSRASDQAFSGLLQTVFPGWAKRDPKAAVAFALEIANPAVRRRALELSVSAWAGHDLPGAVEWLRSVTDENVRERLEPEILQKLAEKDANAAVDFAKSLPPGPQRDHALASVVPSLRRGDGKLIAALTAEIPLSGGKFAGAYQTWIDVDATAAFQDFFTKFSGLTQPDEKAEVEKTLDMIVMLSDANLADALAKVPDGPDNALRDRLLAGQAAALGGKDAAKAQSWAEALPSGTARDTAFLGIAAGWARAAANDAAEWLQALPAGPDRNAAITGFVGATFDKDPAGALAWVRSIPEPAARERALDTAWRRWAARSAASAAQWRDTTPELTPDQRARLK